MTLFWAFIFWLWGVARGGRGGSLCQEALWGDGGPHWAPSSAHGGLEVAQAANGTPSFSLLRKEKNFSKCLIHPSRRMGTKWTVFPSWDSRRISAFLYIVVFQCTKKELWNDFFRLCFFVHFCTYLLKIKPNHCILGIFVLNNHALRSWRYGFLVSERLSAQTLTPVASPIVSAKLGSLISHLLLEVRSPFMAPLEF